MQGTEFEWDDDKAAANYLKHGVSFENALGIFRDPFAFEQLDERMDYGEERFTIVGMAHGRLLFAAFTMRGEVIRLISARAAEPFEKRCYYEQNA